MAQQLREWIEDQSTRLNNPDINLLIDLYISSPSDQEIRDLTFGLLGDNTPIQTFVNDLNQRRQRAGISPLAPTKPQQLQQSSTKDTSNNNSGLVGNPQVAALPTNSNSMASYAQPTVLSYDTLKRQQQQQQSSLQPNQLDPKSSFASKATQQTDNNNKTQQPSNDPNAHNQQKHAQSLNSGVFFTQDDVGVLDVAHLMHKDIKEQNKIAKNQESLLNPHAANQELFPTLGGKGNVNAKGSANNDDNNCDDFAAQLGLGVTNRFHVQDKRKKNATNNNTKASALDDVKPQLAAPTLQQQQQQQTNPYDDIITYSSHNSTRPQCNCMARKHKFYGNCHDCGRIICQYEGEGDCFYCGSYIINFEANRELIALYNRIHQQGEKDGKNKSNKKGTSAKDTKTKIQVTHETRQSLHSNPNDQKQNEIELLEMMTNHHKEFITQLNVNGNGIVCIPNEIFFEKMEQWAQNAQGYQFRVNKSRSQQQQQRDANTSTATTGGGVDSRVSSIEIRSSSAYGGQTVNSAVSEEDRAALGLKKALEFRNTLIQREKEKAKRTKVIDEQADYYDFESNIWLSQNEKAKQQKIAEKVEDLLEQRGEMRTLSIEIDEKTGKVKQNFIKEDLSMKGLGSVGRGNEDIVKKAAQIIDKQEARHDLLHGQGDGNVVSVEHHGKAYSQRELAKRKEFFQIRTRRINLDEQRREQEQKDSQKATDEINPLTKQANDSKKKLDIPTSHLSGRALLVFQTLTETLKPEVVKGGDDDFDQKLLQQEKQLMSTTWTNGFIVVA
jgi:hypothetical protein